MARTNTTTADNEPPTATQPVAQTAASADSPSSTVATADSLTSDAGAAAAQAAVTQVVTNATAASADSAALEAELTEASSTAEVTIYPLRSYLDGKEVRRAGGDGYKSPKHDAVSLIAAGLATDKKPKV
jgi:hypothetical protein